MSQKMSPPRIPSLIAGVAFGALGACTKDVGTSFPVEVTALGNAAAITVTLEWSDGSETLDLQPDAKGHFTTQLGSGTGVLVRGPGDCRFSNGDNAIALTTADETSEISLACPAALDLVDLGPSLPVIQTQENLSFQLTLGALRVNPSPDVLITPHTKYPGATVKINNASAPQRLRLGTNSVDVAYPGFGLSRSYTVTLTNAAKERELSRVPGPNASGQLGAAIAADGDTVVVAQPGVGIGQVLVYRLGAIGWGLEATLKPDDSVVPNLGNGFGAALALSGDTLVVGAPFDDNGADNVGAIYVFQRNGTSWAPAARVTTLSPQSRFGAAVALGAGGWIAVGAPGEASSRGAVYLYAKGGLTGAPASVTAINGESDDGFGTSIAFAGETAAEPVPRLFVGAPGEDGATATPTTDNSRSNAGAVYRYALSVRTWLADGFYKAQPMAVANAGFGKLVAGSGDWLAMAWHTGTAGAVDCFSASTGFRYSISSTSPIAALAVDRGRIAVGQLGAGAAVKIAAQRLDPSSPVVMAPPFSSATASGDDGFGRSLGFAGERLFVGAKLQGATQLGAFYAFE